MEFNKKTVIIIIAVLVILIAIGIYIYRTGKKQVTLQYGPGELPGSNKPAQIGASNEEIKLIANDLYNDMKGLNLVGHDMTVYRRAVLLNDNDIINLYNAFNSLYQKEYNQTLTQWLENEAFSSTFESAAGVLEARLKKLNLL